MANVAFRKGTELALGSVTPVEGTFYFTTDSHKLYLGDENNRLVDLTHFINYVESTTDLPSTAKEGSMYYVTGSNIFCIRNNNSSSPYYTQINPNTTLTANVNGAIAVSTITDGVSVATSVSDTDGNTASGSFSIVEGNGNIHITRNGSVISISADNNADDHLSSLGTQYSTSNGVVRLTETLNSTATDTYDVTFAGSGWATVSSSAATGTGANTVTIDVPVKDVATTVGFNSSGLMTVSSSLAASQSNGTATPTIAYGKPSTTGGTPPGSETFKSGTATLDVYTTSQVDTLLTNVQQSMNAMTYLGTVNATTGPAKLASTSGNVGDTYKVSAAFTYAGDDYKVGDLIIAQGTDGNVTWEVVPSGDDQLIGGAVATNYFQVNDSLTGTNSSLLKVNLAESSDTTKAKINVSGSVISAGSNGVGAEVTYTFSHGAAGTGTAETFTTTATTPTVDANYNVTNVASTIDVYSISGISKDSVGHVTSITTSKYTISDTHNHLSAVNVTSSVSSNAATVGVQVTNTDGDTRTGNFVIKTSSTAPDTGGGLKITRPSGETNSVQIDMVWGSF